MTQKRTSSAKKTTVNTKRKTTTKRRSSRKSSKKIPAYKMIVYCALGISICILAYLVIDIGLKTPEVIDAPSVTERFEDTEKSEEKKETASKAEKAEKTAQKETKKKSTSNKTAAETVKNLEPPAAKTKTDQKNGQTQTAAKASVNTAASPAPAKTSASAGTSAGAGTTAASEAPVTNGTSPAGAKTSATSGTAVSSSNGSAVTGAAGNSGSAVSAAKASFNFPAAQNGAKLVFLFDDGGQNMAQLEKFVTLPFPVTVAVLPQIAHSVEAGARVRSSGNELMLHQPMQSVNSAVNPGPGAITPSMTEEEIVSTLFTNVNQIGPIAGFNNHEGSAITADAEKMAVVLKFASEEGIYFLDSRTNVETKVPYVAEQLGYSYYERNIFLDNEKTRENVLKELNKGLKIANQNGQVIMIAHVWSADFLPALLKEIYPELVSKGYKFCTVSQCEKKN